MAFEIFEQQFGDLKELVVQDSATKNRFVVIPELGGIVRQLSLLKDETLFSVLKTPATPHLLTEDSRSASELLFPFASRIPDGKYRFLGKDYELDKNEDGNLNAIHGLVRKKPFEIEEQIIEDQYALIRLSFHLKELKGYPFELQFSVTYKLDAAGTFTLKYEAENKGTSPAPVMFGWHPYFLLGNESADAWKINIPSDEIVAFDYNSIPTGKEPFTVDMPTLLYKKAFDNCFVIRSQNDSAVTQLISENQDVTLNVRQGIGADKFNFLVVYTPPARDCVAIEPLTANVNAFNSGEGLNIVAPGNQVEGTIQVFLT
ncbi:aldose 1-epimerase [Dyadobacter sediminis]|uniref:Aldose 1-epimerase n=1 Tax=Dyadobacter sediminis TaxID=1493691 RepID=A0A5R9KAT2_9BACT|nr:aldose 1-epimerase [Dyadobacter sediminis]TLU91844.1 aldose 1-epimerase [Dyadobacter sediminis]GGB99797.1 aldose epimerase [Dyadobacter sediminis]